MFSFEYYLQVIRLVSLKVIKIITSNVCLIMMVYLISKYLTGSIVTNIL